MSLVFAVSVLLVFYAYFGYPIDLSLFGLIRRKQVARAPIEPRVSLIITVCNEERRVREKLENTAALDYPKDKLQVLVVSDGSTDRTEEITRSFSRSGIEFVGFPQRRGKESCQKDAVAVASGEILVFSDVATFIEPQGLREIVSNFADPTVGCVSSVDRLIGRDGEPCGEGFYVRYEMWLRDLESRACSLVGLSGSFFAARRQVCADFSEKMQSDFRTLLNSLRLGFRGVSDPSAVGSYRDISDRKREFDRKVRTVLRGLTVFFHNAEFLNIFRYGLFSYQFLCHKLLRWLVPLFLFIALASNAVLAMNAPIWGMVLGLQIFFYGAALGAWTGRFPSSALIFKIPLYFVTVNTAILVAWWQFLKGTRMVMWTPSER